MVTIYLQYFSFNSGFCVINLGRLRTCKCICLMCASWHLCFNPIKWLLSWFDTEITTVCGWKDAWCSSIPNDENRFLSSTNTDVHMIVRGVIDAGESLSFINKIVRGVESRLRSFHDLSNWNYCSTNYKSLIYEVTLHDTLNFSLALIWKQLISIQHCLNWSFA